MEGFDPRASFGEEISTRYVVHETRGDEDETVAFLEPLARAADALEFAIGTGRVALPLARTGVTVDGIEQSPHMIDRMREKPDDEQLDVVLGDMATVDMGRRYGLVYLVYNTIGNLLTQEEQVRCFENASRHLTPGGRVRARVCRAKRPYQARAPVCGRRANRRGRSHAARRQL